MKSILSYYNFRNKINFEAIQPNYDLTEIPDKLIISKDNELSNESKLLKHFLIQRKLLLLKSYLPEHF